MLKVLRWSTIGGFTAAAVYFWQRGDWEIALTSIILPLLVGLVPLLFQVKSEDGTKRESWFKSISRGRDFKKRYFSFLRYQNRDFDIKGLSTQTEHTLELDQVFVELKLQQQAAHKATADPLQNIPSKLRGDSHPIWRFFNLVGEEKKQNPRLVIVGPPGSGKTTLLRHIALLLALSSKSDNEVAKIKKIPVLLFLRDHISEMASQPSLLLPDVIESNIKKWDIAPAPNWFSDKLKKGKCLVLLDGLDEVADPLARRKMVDWLERQIHAYPENAFIITSRPHGYKENPIAGVNVLEVMPFNRGQIDNFVQRWYLANEVKSHSADDPGVRMTAKSGADDLLRRLEKTPTLMELAVNPLLLTMIATVHRYRSALPGRRVELYKEICEVFLGKRQESKGISIDMIPAQKQSVLETLAYEMMCGNTREIRKTDALEVIQAPLAMVAPNLAPETFLKSIEQQTGLLLERELGVYSFAHKTFQEYLASMYVLGKNLEEHLYARINDDWWHEVIKLYSAQTDATQIIITCLDQDPPSAVALSLAVQCLEEAHQVKPELRKITERILLENAEDEDPDIRTIIAQALLSSRLKHLFALSPAIFIDTHLVTNAEYQLFINEMLWRGKGNFSPAHWADLSFPPGTAHAPTLGLTPDDALAFCDWLTELYAGSGEWYFRLPVKNEINAEIYAEVPGFWMSSEKDTIAANIVRDIEVWKNPAIPWRAVPTQFMKKTAQEDIKKIIFSLRVEDDWIKEPGNEIYLEVNHVLKRILQSTSRSDHILSETANEIYKTIIQLPTSKGINFGYGSADPETYDQTISDNIERIANHDFEAGIMSALKCFSSLIHSNPRTSGRFKPVYIAFAFVFLTKWIEKNKKLFVKIDMSGIQSKVDFVLDWYRDSLIAYARQYNVVEPFEGLIFVKEIKERHVM